MPVEVLLHIDTGGIGALVQDAKFGVLEEQPRHAHPLLLACSQPPQDTPYSRQHKHPSSSHPCQLHTTILPA